MNQSLFISDLHLSESRPQITATFLDFLEATARQADNLFILGDLFEYWAGDDDLDDPWNHKVVRALHKLAPTTKCFFIHGNRDFLVGNNFCEASGMTLLPDPYLMPLHGRRILLSHGDALCTDDVDYQAFRKQVRNPAWVSQFTQQPLAIRKAMIEGLRQQSEQAKSNKLADIMDVNETAVEELLRNFDYPELFIHGHTHRPKVHDYLLSGQACTRVVLGDWYEQGSFLMLDAHGFQAIKLND